MSARLQHVVRILLIGLAATACSAGLSNMAARQSASQPASTPTSAPAKPRPGPRLLMLRYNEDFSYLDGEPGSFTPDFFDPIKFIHIGEDWRLTIGGEARVRAEFNTNETLGDIEPTQDSYVLHRYLLHADLRYSKRMRVFIQGIGAFVDDRETPIRGSDENRWDFNQLFGDLRVLGEETPLTLRIGRQELLYGAARVVAPGDFGNAKRRFDGVKLFWSDVSWNADFWYLRPVVIDRAIHRNRKLDQYDEEAHYFGSYVTYKGVPDHVIDLYFQSLLNTGDVQNADGDMGDLSLYALGGRFAGRRGPWDYDLELTGQWGTFAGDGIAAWAFMMDAGHTWKDAPWKPRLSAGFDFGSGDRDPADEMHQTYNQLFNNAHITSSSTQLTVGSFYWAA